MTAFVQGTVRSPIDAKYKRVAELLDALPADSPAAKQYAAFLSKPYQAELQAKQQAATPEGMPKKPTVMELNVPNAGALEEALKQPGAKERLVAQANDPAAVQASIAAIKPAAPAAAPSPSAPPAAKSPAAQVSTPAVAAPEKPGIFDFVVDTLSTGTTHMALMGKPGYNDFYTKMTADTPQAKSVRESLGKIMGGGAEGAAGEKAALQKLSKMAEKDPEIFNKLNTIMDAKGIDGFMKTVSNNPELKQMFEAGDGPDGVGSSVKTIDALHKAIKEDPDFLTKSDELIKKYPQMVASASESMTNDPGGGIAKMQQMIGFNDMKNNMLGFVGQMSPEFAKMLGGVFDKFVEMFGPGLMGIMGTAAAAPAEIKDAADKQELHGAGSGELAGELVRNLQPGQTLTYQVGPDGAKTYSVASAPDNSPTPQGPQTPERKPPVVPGPPAA